MSSKLSLIINREYTTRVRKKSFIIMSLLMPVGMLLLMALPTLIAMVGQTEASKIAVIDRTQRYGQALTDDSSATYSLLAADTDEDSLRSAYEAGGFDAYMVIGGRPDGKDSVRLYSQSTLPMETVRHTEDDLREALRREMMDNYEGHSGARHHHKHCRRRVGERRLGRRGRRGGHGGGHAHIYVRHNHRLHGHAGRHGREDQPHSGGLGVVGEAV